MTWFTATASAYTTGRTCRPLTGKCARHFYDGGRESNGSAKQTHDNLSPDLQEAAQLPGLKQALGGDGCLEVVNEVDAFPGEEVAFRLPPEVAVSCSGRVNRLVQAEMDADAAGR